MTGTEPDEHHFRIGIDVRQRFGAHLREGLYRIAVDFGDARYRIAFRKHSA